MSYATYAKTLYKSLKTNPLYIKGFLGDSGWSSPQGRSISHPNPKPLKKKGKIGGLLEDYIYPLTIPTLNTL
jgi:hypothetical protein